MNTINIKNAFRAVSTMAAESPDPSAFSHAFALLSTAHELFGDVAPTMGLFSGTDEEFSELAQFGVVRDGEFVVNKRGVRYPIQTQYGGPGGGGLLWLGNLFTLRDELISLGFLGIKGNAHAEPDIDHGDVYED